MAFYSGRQQGKGKSDRLSAKRGFDDALAAGVVVVAVSIGTVTIVPCLAVDRTVPGADLLLLSGLVKLLLNTS